MRLRKEVITVGPPWDCNQDLRLLLSHKLLNPFTLEPVTVPRGIEDTQSCEAEAIGALDGDDDVL